jgi:hypothetical protein
LLNRGEQTLRAVTGSGGRLHFGMVADIKSERRPTSNRNPRPDCVGIRTQEEARTLLRWLGAADVRAYSHVARSEKRLAASATAMQPRSYEPRAGVRIRIVRREGVQRRARKRMAVPRPIIRGHDLDIAEEQASVAAPLDPNASPDACMVRLTNGRRPARSSLRWPFAGHLAVCHAGRVAIVLPPQLPQRRRLPASGTVRVSGRASTLTSALWPQAWHEAVTSRTPLARMLARVIGGPGLERMSGAPIARVQL